MSNYKILGRSGAGSLIPEFLLTELEIEYDIEFPKSADLQNEKYMEKNISIQRPGSLLVVGGRGSHSSSKKKLSAVYSKNVL